MVEEVVPVPGPSLTDAGLEAGSEGEVLSLDRNLQQAKSTPVRAFACLIVTGLTSIISLAVLLGIRNRPIWPSNGVYGFMQPASWLSLLLSLSGICLHMALSDGTSIMWWRQASKEHATVEDLHLAWAAGTSYLDALRARAWKRYKYFSFTMGAVLLIPINGFLLQGATSSRLATQVHHDNITVPMVPFLDPGFAGFNASSDIVLDLGGSPWPGVWAQVQNILGSKNAPYAYIGTYEDWYDDGQPETFPFTYREDSNYTAYAQGTGFDVSCETSSTLHNFTLSEKRNVTGGRIFSATVGYDLKYPNNMTVDVSWKNESDCVFHMIRKRCTLAAATVTYPIQVQMKIPSSTYTGPFFSLQDGTTRQNDKTVRILPVFQGEGEYNWTYAGIPKLVGGYYNSSIDIIDYLGGTNGSWNPNGPLADVLATGYVTETEYYCQIDLVGGLQYLAYLQSLDNPIINVNTEIGDANLPPLDIAEVILSRIRQAMFLSSVYMGAEWYTVLRTNFNASDEHSSGELPYGRSHYVQELPALRSIEVAVYQVRLYLWAISLGITWIVMAIIIPTFWGYWSLTRPPSMSPVDVARAFHAPLLAEINPGHDINRVLQVIGKKNVHQVMVQGRMDQQDQESKAEAS